MLERGWTSKAERSPQMVVVVVIVREVSPPKSPKHSGLGIIVICPGWIILLSTSIFVLFARKHDSETRCYLKTVQFPSCKSLLQKADSFGFFWRVSGPEEKKLLVDTFFGRTIGDFTHLWFFPHILREDSHFESYFLAGLKPPPIKKGHLTWKRFFLQNVLPEKPSTWSLPWKSKCTVPYKKTGVEHVIVDGSSKIWKNWDDELGFW